MGGGGGYKSYPQSHKSSTQLTSENATDNCQKNGKYAKNLIKNNVNAHITHSESTKSIKCAQRGSIMQNYKNNDDRNIKLYSQTAQRTQRRRSTSALMLLWFFAFALFACVYFMNAPQNNATATGTATVASTSLSGSGTSASPYLIQSGSDMLFLSTTSSASTYWASGKYFKLTNDVEIIANTWSPIGNSTTKFQGNFDGQGYIITIKSTNGSAVTITSNYAGLFGFVGGTVENESVIEKVSINWANGLSVTPSSTTSYAYVGGLVASTNGTLTNVGNYGNIEFDNPSFSEGKYYYTYVGGVVGEYRTTQIGTYELKSAVLSNAFNYGSINVSTAGSIYCAGIVAQMEDASLRDGSIVTNCKFIGDINATSSVQKAYVGGITYRVSRSGDSAGDPGGVTYIENCFVVTNNLNGDTVGGIASDLHTSRSNSFSEGGVLKNCFVATESSATISGTKVGYFAGNNAYGTESTCKYGSNITLSGTTKDTWGTSDSTLNLKSVSTFSGWDTNIWNIVDGKYPSLKALKQLVTAHTITFDVATNGGSGASISTAMVEVEDGESLTMATLNAQKALALKTNWTCIGWNRTAGEVDVITADIANVTDDFTLYAVFSRDLVLNFYELNATTAKQVKGTIYNNSMGTRVNTPALSNSSYTKVGWSGTTDYTGSVLDQNRNIPLNEDNTGATFYAVYSHLVSVNYNANGGSGTMTASTGTAYLIANKTTSPNKKGVSIALKNNTFTKAGNKFTKWAKGSVTGVQYGAGASVSLNENTTFYAIWEKNVYLTKFNVTFNNETPKGGIFVYILRDDGNGGYTEFYSSYFDGKTDVSFATYELENGATYSVVISKPYVWDFDISGTNVSGAGFSNGIFTFTTASDSGTINITATGGTPPNTFTVV